MKKIKNLKEEIKKGSVFIYPTDTIYGIGCNAEDIDSVKRIREIKKRDSKPFSVIAPEINWIHDNFVVDVDLEKYLPGPYTLILKKKQPDFLNWVSDTDTLGIRIPDNDFTREIQKTGFPFITTSVNIAGEPHLTRISDLNADIRNNVDYIIDIGELTGKPSTLVINGKEIKR